MRLVNSLILKKQENENLFLRAVVREFAFQEHISAYLMALAVLGLDDPELEKKKKLWRRFITSNRKDADKNYQRVLQFKPAQDVMILKALDYIDELKKRDSGASFGRLYQPYTWGCLSYEYELGG